MTWQYQSGCWIGGFEEIWRESFEGFKEGDERGILMKNEENPNFGDSKRMTNNGFWKNYEQDSFI